MSSFLKRLAMLNPKQKRRKKSDGSAEKHFTAYLSGKNYMTPDTMEYGWIRPGKLSYLLASGEGLDEIEKIYGVTICRFKKELSAVWPTEKQARLYIQVLQVRLGGEH